MAEANDEAESAQEVPWDRNHFHISNDDYDMYFRGIAVESDITIGELKTMILESEEFNSHPEKTEFWNRESIRLHLECEGELADIQLVPDDSWLKKDHFVPNLDILYWKDPMPQWISFRMDKFVKIRGVPNPYQMSQGKEDRYQFLQGMEWDYRMVPDENGSVLKLKEWLEEKTGIPLQALHISWDDCMSMEDSQDLCVKQPNTGKKIPDGGILRVWASSSLVHVMSLRQHLFTCGTETAIERAADAVVNEGEVIEDYLLLTPDGVLTELTLTNSLPAQGNDGCRVYLVHKAHTKSPEAPPGQQLTIHEPELRGLSVQQIRHLATNLIIHCTKEKWKSTNPNPPLAGKTLNAEEVTLYDLMKLYVYPTTKARQCSYAEFVSTSAKDQKPNYFVSHWWGESVLNFVACVLQHAHDRKLPEDTTYWICAYSLNQHNLKNEMGTSLESTPFFKAMQNTVGTLSILDGEATCYERLWCAFEISIIFQRFKEKDSQFWKHDYAYGMYAISQEENDLIIPGSPVGLTDGLVAIDGNDPYKKRKRESKFPIGVCSKALAVEFQNAKVSRPADRSFILNTIIGETGESKSPPESHEAYNDLNASVRARFAEATYGIALGQMVDIKLFRDAIESAALTHLTLNFFDCPEFCEEAKDLLGSLPLSLVHLELIVGGISFERDEQFASGLGRLTNLTTFKLKAGQDDNSCGQQLQIENIDRLCCELRNLCKLEDLVLDLDSQRHLKSIDALEEACSQMPSLHTFSLDLKMTGLHNPSLAENASLEVAGIVHSHPCLCNLKLEHVPFSSRLGEALVKMTKLSTFNYSPSDGRTIGQEDFELLCSAVTQMTQVEELSLSFDAPNLDSLGVALKGFTHLKKLHLESWDAPSLSEVGRTLANGSFVHIEELQLELFAYETDDLHFMSSECLPKLKTCRLTCFCLDEENFTTLGVLIQNLQDSCFPHLEEFALKAIACHCEDIGFMSEATMPRLQKLHLSLDSCQLGSVGKLTDAFKRSTGWKLQQCKITIMGSGVSQNDLVVLAREFVECQSSCREVEFFSSIDDLDLMLPNRRSVFEEAKRRGLELNE